MCVQTSRSSKIVVCHTKTPPTPKKRQVLMVPVWFTVVFKPRDKVESYFR